jgi:hypothetical protein
MIVVNSDGRMGNQMFQYAFALAVSKNLSTRFFIDEQHHRFLLPEYFEMPSFHSIFNQTGRKILKKLNELGCWSLSEKLVPDDKEPADLLLKIQDDCIYKGFFQSKKYFENVEVALKRKEFIVKQKWLSEFEKRTTGLYDEVVEGRIVVAHVRRTDYVGSMDLPSSYYFDIIDDLKLTNKDRLIFISDDPAYVDNVFGRKYRCEVSSNSGIVDFQILQNADVLILANSSFAWWAGFLKKKDQAEVFAPRDWLGFMKEQEFPVGVMTNDFTWKKVPFQKSLHSTP